MAGLPRGLTGQVPYRIPLSDTVPNLAIPLERLREETIVSVEVLEKNGQRLVIDYDRDPMNPREWDNATVMLCFHGKYRLGDMGLPYREGDYDSWGEVRQALLADGHTNIRPLYLYDHSGLAIRVGSDFAEYGGWDSGQVGFVYIPAGSEIDPTRADSIIADEVAEYDKYLRGEVYYYRVEQDSKCDSCGHTEVETVDSCGGFYSVAEAMESAGWEE